MMVHHSLSKCLNYRLSNLRAFTPKLVCSLIATQYQSILAKRLLSTNSIVRSDQETPTSESYNTIALTRPHKHVVHVEFNRPKVKNAFSVDTARDFMQALRHLEEDSSVRCLMLSGRGPDFTSGVDLKNFMGAYALLQDVEDVARRAKFLLNVIKQVQAPFMAMHSFNKPIVCVLHGTCFGLAMELAACSDIRYCSNDAKLSISEVLIGIAADVGSLQLMPKLVSNQSLLRELIYTGRTLTTDEAINLGFVSKICDTKSEAIKEALETATVIASRSPVAVQGSKQNLRFSSDKSLRVGLNYNAVWNSSMMQSNDLVKAISAIMTKSKEPVEYDDY